MLDEKTYPRTREIIHWIWLWILAAIVVAIMHGGALGQESAKKVEQRGLPIPMPNIDAPDLFQFPHDELKPADITIEQALLQTEARDYQLAIRIWEKLPMKEDSITWQHVGIGAAQLRLTEFDDARLQLGQAIEVDPTNAVAEYFLGQLCRAQLRHVPFWYDTNSERALQLVAFHPNRRPTYDLETKTQIKRVNLAYHYKKPALEREAKQHFRRAIKLARNLDLDRPINTFAVGEPNIQLVSSNMKEAITVRHLLISLGEAGFVKTAEAELGVTNLSR